MLYSNSIVVLCQLIEAVSASESDEEPLKDEDDDSSIATNEFEDEVENKPCRLEYHMKTLDYLCSC